MSPTPVTFTSPTAPASYSWEATDEEVAARYGVPIEQVVRFDLNTSPAPPELATRVLATGRFETPLSEYAPSDYRRLVAAAAARYGVEAGEIIVGAGADEVLDIVGKVFLAPGANAVVPTPSYAMYRVITEQRGATVTAVPRLGAASGYAIDLPAVRAATSSAALLWLCSPNNPTALSEPDGTIEALLDGLAADAAAAGRPAPIVVLDEAYAEFVDRSLVGLRHVYPNLIVVRTASKAYGLAGLRVGFGIARPEVIAQLNPFRPPGSVSTVSATVVTEALLDPGRRSGQYRSGRSGAGPAGHGAARPRLDRRSVGHELPARRPWVAGGGVGRRRSAPAARPRATNVPGWPSPGRSSAIDRARARRERPTDRGRPWARRGRRRGVHVTTPLGEYTVGARELRRVTVARSTRETEVTVTLGLDGEGQASIATGLGFYDHLLGSFAHHGLFDLAVAADGDLAVDEHHTVEDVALVLGVAFGEALGDRAGIQRFGEASVPMDEALATAVVDVGGRPYAVIDLPFRGERVGALPLQLIEHALESFARTSGTTLHLRGAGRNDHHLAEAAFKALARAVRAACEPDPRRVGVASTKGSLG